MSLQKKILNFDLITRLPSPPYHLFPLSVSRRDGTVRRRSRCLCPRVAAPLLSTAARAVLIPSRWPSPFSPSLRSPRARAEPSRAVPPPASHRPNPAAPARFFAPQAASPCPAPIPTLPELGRAVSRPESSRHHRPPLMLPSSSAPGRRSPTSGPPPPDSRAW